MRAVITRKAKRADLGLHVQSVYAASLPDGLAELLHQPSADDSVELLGIFVLHALIATEQNQARWT